MPVPSRQRSRVVNWPGLLSSRGWWGVNSGDYYETLNYGYDAARNLVQIGYPSSINLTYTRNSAAQVTGVRLAIGNKTATLASNISYLPFGPVNSLTWGNGILLSRTYDQDYQLTQQQVGNWQTTYRYDADSNISETATSLWGAVQYEYDALGRLTQEQTNSVKKAYSFDATGNRTQRTTTSLTTSDATDTQSLNYASDSNRLTSINGSTLPMDAAGNHTQINGRRFTYDSQGRLSEVYQANIYKIADYKYNALGQRIIKRAYVMGSQALAGTTTYLYDPSGKLIGQTFYDGNGQKTSGQYWFWLDNMPLAQLTANFSTLGEVSSSKLIYLHVDHLNTPRLATDSTQALLWRWNSDAYGVGAPEEDVDGDGKAATIALRFPGQIYDAQTQLSYNYYRDYNPDTGRYVQSDPIGLGGGLNTFGYVLGNPLKYTDPKGLNPLALCFVPGIGWAACTATAEAAASACAAIGTAVTGALLGGFFAEELPNSGDKDASTPTGQRGSPIDVESGTNEPTEIDGREYSGHALDRMQGRGVPPSAVEDAIQNGKSSSGNTPGTTVHVGSNGVTVVTNSGGRVITVIPK
ncbi:YD repeat-containing protein [Pseudomonas amygdali pv. eriobotryae]|uniref:YD repeat-containing protein n=1 Tax=Pseudomonas amygdali pv. eriobotryae TaxID=129137 RepID=A0A3M3WRD7_PSEA0|nr:YD repeat-containing protein [Pseudomonas amygdali pv. eriobotryae]